MVADPDKFKQLVAERFVVDGVEQLITEVMRSHATIRGIDGSEGHRSWVKWVNTSGWVTRVVGQFNNDSYWSWVTKCDPLSFLATMHRTTRYIFRES